MRTKSKPCKIGDKLQVQLKHTIDPAMPVVTGIVSRVGGKSGKTPLRVMYSGAELCLTIHCRIAR